MKKFAVIGLSLLMMVSLAACNGKSETKETESMSTENTQTEEASELESTAEETAEADTNAVPTEAEPDTNAVPTEAEPDTDAVTSEAESDTGETEIPEGSEILVTYFSATHTTEGVAETMAEILSADLYQIVPEEPYTDADLDYNDDNSRSTIEMNDPSARPAISGSVENWEQYDTVFIGYPIWWGEAPRILDTFVESYDFSGKTIVPFCTSGGSGIGSSAENLAELTEGANWISGDRLNGGSSRDEIVTWINGLGLDISVE